MYLLYLHSDWKNRSKRATLLQLFLCFDTSNSRVQTTDVVEHHVAVFPRIMCVHALDDTQKHHWEQTHSKEILFEGFKFYTVLNFYDLKYYLIFVDKLIKSPTEGNLTSFSWTFDEAAALSIPRGQS